jgi:hypothetical protein
MRISEASKHISSNDHSALSQTQLFFNPVLGFFQIKVLLQEQWRSLHEAVVVETGAARGVVLAVDEEVIVEDLEAEEVAEAALGVSHTSWSR